MKKPRIPRAYIRRDFQSELGDFQNPEFVRAVAESSNRNTSATAPNAEKDAEKHSSKKKGSKEN